MTLEILKKKLEDLVHSEKERTTTQTSSVEYVDSLKKLQTNFKSYADLNSNAAEECQIYIDQIGVKAKRLVRDLAGVEIFPGDIDYVMPTALEMDKMAANLAEFGKEQDIIHNLVSLELVSPRLEEYSGVGPRVREMLTKVSEKMKQLDQFTMEYVDLSMYRAELLSFLSLLDIHKRNLITMYDKARDEKAADADLTWYEKEKVSFRHKEASLINDTNDLLGGKKLQTPERIKSTIARWKDMLKFYLSLKDSPSHILIEKESKDLQTHIDVVSLKIEQLELLL